MREKLKKEAAMKTIVVQWVKEDQFGYGKAMRVVASEHPRFTVGHRFDFGFMEIVTDEGYTVISLPIAAQLSQSRAHQPTAALRRKAQSQKRLRKAAPVG